jgi:mono/diheme cytochrome c family protein
MLLLLLGSGSALAADGAALYQANCASCHGADGKADGPVAKAMNVPPLAGTGLSPEAVVKTVKDGGKHKAQADKLSAEELDAIAGALPG